MQADIFNAMISTPPDLSLADAGRIARDHFNIHAEAKLLVSDRDQNFRLQAEDGKYFLLKIANHAELARTVDFQNEALAHIAVQDASLPIPRVIPTGDRQLYTRVKHDDRSHIVRVLSWLDGTTMHDAPAGRKFATRLGALLARMGLALREFDHPGSNPPQSWDMKRAGDLRELLPCIGEEDARKLIGGTLNHFDKHIEPVLKTLRSQVIYNDLNPGNVLRDKTDPQKISGIIDFGDLVKSPLIIDLAVACAYQLAAGDDPLAGALPLIAAYHAVCPLQRVEMELLTDLIRTRLITSLLINTYRTTLFPENRVYQMISFNAVKASLTGLRGMETSVALERIRAVCDPA